MAKQTISLASYTLKIKDNSYSSEPIINDFGGRDLLNILEDLFESWKKHAVKINNLGDAVKCVELIKDGRYLKGILQKGGSGTEQDIEDLEKKMVIHKMTKEQTVLNPYYFLFYIPEDQKKAICLFQRRGNSSPIVIIDFLEHYFKEKFTPYTAEFNYLLQKEVLDEITKSEQIRELRLTQYKWSPDDADNIFGQTAEPLKVVVSYRSRYNLTLTDKVRNVLSGAAKPSTLVEHDIKPDEVTVVTKIGKRKRTFTFAEEKDAEFRPYRDISSEVKYSEANHPTFESIDLAATNFMKELSNTMYEKPS